MRTINIWPDDRFEDDHAPRDIRCREHVAQAYGRQRRQAEIYQPSRMNLGRGRHGRPDWLNDLKAPGIQ